MKNERIFNRALVISFCIIYVCDGLFEWLFERKERMKMIAIKGMEMPKSCSECPFKANDYVCRLLDCAFSCNHFKERNYNCPLVEIVTCKDCKYWHDDGIMTTCDKNIGHGFPKDHFCADGERRE